MFNSLRSLALVVRFVTTAFPLVSRELNTWRIRASHCPDSELAAQALASIAHKKFHCQGGSIYGLYPGVNTTCLISLIVALQTISDYLDNLCDRAGIYDEVAFRQLHQAMTDALDPDRPLAAYYAFYPLQDDGGYLAALVEACRHQVSSLPSYHLVKPHLLQLAGLYSDLQTYKHLAPDIRQEKMLAWINCHLRHYPDLGPWEFAAATGSTLGMFMLFAAAANPRLTEAEASAIKNAYFPSISGLHILLDYFIDLAEDRHHGDLNFVAYYASEAETSKRLIYFTSQALTVAKHMPNSLFHQTVVKGLLAMYLSDPKTNQDPEKSIKKALLEQAGRYTKVLYGLCRALRIGRVL